MGDLALLLKKPRAVAPSRGAKVPGHPGSGTPLRAARPPRPSPPRGPRSKGSSLRRRASDGWRSKAGALPERPATRQVRRVRRRPAPHRVHPRPSQRLGINARARGSNAVAPQWRAGATFWKAASPRDLRRPGPTEAASGWPRPGAPRRTDPRPNFVRPAPAREVGEGRRYLDPAPGRGWLPIEG